VEARENMLTGLPYMALRDAIIAHPTMPEGWIFLLMAVPARAAVSRSQQPAKKEDESMELSDFKDLVDRHYPMLYRFALGLGCTEAYACDLIQQSFSSWTLRKNVACNDAHAKSGLLAELYRRRPKNDRHENRPTQPDNLAQGDLAPWGVPAALDLLEPEEVMECLQSINETFRVPLLLFYLGEQSFDEIAGILTISPEVAISRLSMGKRVLQSILLRR
jgi:RNA polymerase sigma-70 factor (ECF subfamily)